MADNDDKRRLHDTEIQTKSPRLFMCTILLYTLLAVGCVISVLVYSFTDKFRTSDANLPQTCPLPADSCIFTLVESIPDNLTFPAGSPVHPTTFSGIHEMLGMAQETIEIASYYWALRSSDVLSTDPSSWAGEQLFNDLLAAGKDRGIKIRIVQSQSDEPVKDTLALQAQAGAQVRSIDFKRLIGSGILHTKLWIIDRKHFYIGSANLDWRSFTQVKEMGAVVQQCGCLANDIGKIFDAYWYLATPSSKIPATWPEEFNTIYNAISPMQVNFNGTLFDTFLSSSPPPICPKGRTGDGDTIVEIINSAEKYVHVAVMDYFPTTQFNHPRKYWPVIDNALRSAAFDRRVGVKLLFSYWNHTWDDMIDYMWSLQDLKYSDKDLNIDIQVACCKCHVIKVSTRFVDLFPDALAHFETPQDRSDRSLFTKQTLLTVNPYSAGTDFCKQKAFIVPAYTDAQRKIPYSRVNHNKYMVTDKTAYIGTSNWSGDYFLVTGGIGLVTSKHPDQGNRTVDIRQQLEDVFNRDWYSNHAHNLSHFNRTMFN